MPTTDVLENSQIDLPIFNTVKKAFKLIVGAGLVLIWKQDVFWFERRNLETTKRFAKILQENLTKAQPLLHFIPVRDTHTNTEEKCIAKDKHVPIIAICLVTTDRFSSVLDFGLDGLEDTEYDRTLVIMIHPANKGELTVSTKRKVELTDNYKNLKNVIDARLIPGSFKIFSDKIEGYHQQNVKEEVEKFLKTFHEYEPITEMNAGDIKNPASENDD